MDLRCSLNSASNLGGLPTRPVSEVMNLITLTLWIFMPWASCWSIVLVLLKLPARMYLQEVQIYSDLFNLLVVIFMLTTRGEWQSKQSLIFLPRLSGLGNFIF